jgi:hypothetical protein
MGGLLKAKCMAEEQHNNWNGEDADRADDVANNVSDAHGVFSFVGGWWGPKPPTFICPKFV